MLGYLFYLSVIHLIMLSVINITSLNQLIMKMKGYGQKRSGPNFRHWIFSCKDRRISTKNRRRAGPRLEPAIAWRRSSSVRPYHLSVTFGDRPTCHFAAK
jgi:hypothetical protein